MRDREATSQKQDASRDRVRVSFHVVGQNLDFDFISNCLHVKPSYTHRAGDLSLLKKPLPADMWTVFSSLREEESVDAHLLSLATAIRKRLTDIQHLQQTADVYFYCSIITERPQSGFDLSPETLATLAEIGVVVEVSFLFG